MAPIDDGMEQANQALAHGLMQIKGPLNLVLDSAEGIKAEMIGRGWTPQNAETVALAYVQVALQKVLGMML